MSKTHKEEQLGKINVSELREMLNKKAGRIVAYNLKDDENPTEVKDWVSTGSTVLDAITCRGKWGGIPCSGRISLLEGLEGTGKSYLAAQIAGNAQKAGFTVFYFDAENAIDPEFLGKAGCDLNTLLYIPAESIEFVLETIEESIGQVKNKCFFIVDSIAMCPCKTDIAGTFDPLESMALKARILSKGMSKLIQPLATSESALLLLNQLKTNLTCPNPKYAVETEKYASSGGKSIVYAASLRIFLTLRTAKESYVTDSRGYRIGSEVKAKIVKSRFGTFGREASFKIIWADPEKIGVLENESILEAVQPFLTQNGAWYSLDGQKFQRSGWDELMKDENFKKKVMNIVEQEIIVKFDKRLGNADEFYNAVKEKEPGSS